MINVNQITSQLARMPDQALQQYAAMHKSDPYVLSLALAESNRRKEIRAGAQMNAPAQPKVADQAIAAMAPHMPEDVGIGQLPAENLRGMAGGGIVAFGDGGEVPRYQYGGVLAGTEFGIPGMTQSTLYQDALARLKAKQPLSDAQKAILAGPPPTDFAEDGNGFYATRTSEEMGSADPFKRLRQFSQWAGRNVERDPITDEVVPKSSSTATLPAMDAATRLSATDKALRSAPALAPPTGSTTPPASGTGLRTSASSAPGMRVPASLAPYVGDGTTLPQTSTAVAQELQNLRGGFSDEIPYAQQQAIESYRVAREKAAKEGLEALQADIAKQGPGMADAERRAQVKEARLSKQETEAGPMALIQAGFAIMGGESPYAAANIGKGASAGLKAYTENMDKLEAARDRLDETFSKIEQFRQNRDDMNRREIRAAQADIRNTAVEAQKLGLEALTKNTEMNRADARAAFDVMARNRQAMYEVGARTALGLEQIGAQERIAANRNALMKDLYGGELKARQEFGKIQMKVMGELKNDTNYQLADPAKKASMETEALRRAIQNNPFLAPFAAGIGFTKAPPPGKMYDLTGGAE